MDFILSRTYKRKEGHAKTGVALVFGEFLLFDNGILKKQVNRIFYLHSTYL